MTDLQSMLQVWQVLLSATGFAQNYLGHFTKQIHQNDFKALKGFSGQVNIWKVHGSLDWFKTKEENDIQLPLRHTIPTDLKPSIVTPGLSKYFETQLEPFQNNIHRSRQRNRKRKWFFVYRLRLQ